MIDILEDLFDQLWPITRSLTGDGNRESLAILGQIVDLKITEIPSGTACLDWNIPPEWNIKDAWVKDENGKKIIDFKKHNLHLLGYSTPIHQTMNWESLNNHLYTLEDQPELIPYLTSYYKERWGFCISHHQWENINRNQSFEIFIDSTLNPNGSMTVAEAFLPGQSKEEIFFSTYICHPSMANNELSGPLVTTMIYDCLKKKTNRKYSYRFLYHPETIGALYHLSHYGDHWKKNLKAGYVITCVGDDAKLTYKRSKYGNSLADRMAEITLKQLEKDYNPMDFFPGGSDERQYCSPGFNLPVGSLVRSMYGRYPEYHTSGDNKEFISFEAMQEVVNIYCEIVNRLENNVFYINQFPYGEPQLGKRNLYPTLSEKKKDNFIKAMKWLLNYSDGEHGLIEIASMSGLDINEFYPVIEQLVQKGILRDSSQ